MGHDAPEVSRRRAARSEEWIDLHARQHFGVLAFLLSAGMFALLAGGFAWVGIKALFLPEEFPEHTAFLMLLSAALAAFVAFAATSNGREETRSNRGFRLLKARIHPRVVHPGESVRCTVRLALKEGRRLADLRVVLLCQELERDLSSDYAVYFQPREFHRHEVDLTLDSSADEPTEVREHSVALTVPAGAVATHTQGLRAVEWNVRLEARFEDGQKWSDDTTIRVL